MARLAQDRDTHLTPEEIAAEALRQFDEGGTPSIRSLAAALKVAPTAIYYHYPSRGAIIEAAVELVWQEAMAIGLELVPDPSQIAADELLVQAGLATRRAFARHGLLALHLAEIPEVSERLIANMSLLAAVFDAMDLHGQEAAEAFHTYASFVIGSTLFLTIRTASGPPTIDTSADPEDPEAGTQEALQWLMRVSAQDLEHDERLFVQGLRKIVATLQPAA